MQTQPPKFYKVLMVVTDIPEKSDDDDDDKEYESYMTLDEIKSNVLSVHLDAGVEIRDIGITEITEAEAIKLSETEIKNGS